MQLNLTCSAITIHSRAQVLGTQQRGSHGSCPQRSYSLEMGKYANVRQHANCCGTLHTGAGSRGKGPPTWLQLINWERLPTVWGRSRDELANQMIPWAHWTATPSSVLPGFELQAFPRIISPPHDLHPAQKPLWLICSRSGKVSPWPRPHRIWFHIFFHKLLLQDNDSNEVSF